MIGMGRDRDKKWAENMQNSTDTDPVVGLVIFIILAISAVITLFVV